MARWSRSTAWGRSGKCCSGGGAGAGSRISTMAGSLWPRLRNTATSARGSSNCSANCNSPLGSASGRRHGGGSGGVQQRRTRYTSGLWGHTIIGWRPHGRWCPSVGHGWRCCREGRHPNRIGCIFQAPMPSRKSFAPPITALLLAMGAAGGGRWWPRETEAHAASGNATGKPQSQAQHRWGRR